MRFMGAYGRSWSVLLKENSLLVLWPPAARSMRPPSPSCNRKEPLGRQRQSQLAVIEGEQ
jgi:hypothetical protein